VAVQSTLDAETLECRIRQLCHEGDLQAAATVALRGHGAEILGYLYALARDEAEAAEAFAMFNEDLWRGLARFRWECRLRTWAYTVARHAFMRLRRDPHRRPDRFVAGTVEIAERIRTTTLPHLRTSVHDRFAQIRAELEPDDQTLLVMRIDRELPWLDVARVLADEADPTDAELGRRAAALRKRFERLKQRIRERLAQLQPNEETKK
jgi:RNA polymerase sigma-70 factor, ECF subfamily